MHLPFSKPASYQIQCPDSRSRKLLVDAGIPFDSADQDVFVRADFDFADEDLFILAEDLPRVLTALNCEVVTTFPSTFNRIDKVILSRRTDGAFTLSVVYEQGQKQTPETERLVSIVASELLPCTKRDVVVHFAGGKISSPVLDGRFHIFLDSAPTDTPTTEIPATIFGIPFKMKSGFFDRTRPVAYKPSGQGSQIVDKKNGFVAAELVGDCLYVHFDVLKLHPESIRLSIFVRLLKNVADQLRADDIVVEILSALGLDPAQIKSPGNLPVRFAKNQPERFARQTLAVIGNLLCTRVTTPIVIYREGGVHAAASEGEFHVYLSGSPANTAKAAVPARVFDVPVTGSKNAWSLGPGSVPVNDGEFVAAQLVGMNNLYLTFNPLNDHVTGLGDIKTELEVLARVLKAALEELDVDGITGQILNGLRDTPDWRHTPPIDAPIKPFAVSVQDFSGRLLSVVTSLTEQLLAPGVGMDVLVTNARGELRIPEVDGRFHVFFNSSPIGTRCTTTPAAVFGIQLGIREAAFWPSGLGVGITDGAGFLAGELVGNNLYLHAQLIHIGTRRGAKLLALIMLAALREFASRSQAGQDASFAEVYRDYCYDRVKARFANLSYNPFNFDHVKQSQTALKDAIAIIRRSEQALQQLNVDEQFGREYDELLAIEKVTNITVGQGQILVETKVLYCSDPRTGHLHEIGAFKIQIPTEGGRLRWHNQTRVVSIANRKMNAPHVGSDGQACEGTTKDEWPLFIARRQYAYVVMKAIQFIESVNTSDVWGKSINHWPVASAR